MLRPLFLSLILAVSSPAGAAHATDTWFHSGSKVGAPAQVGEFRRTGVQDRFRDGLDIALSFAPGDRGTVLSLFLYRPAYADSSLWFQQADIAIRQNPLWKLPQGATATPKPFRVGGAAGIEGSVLSYSARGRASSTALAIVPVNGWLVKLRMSSTGLDQQELEAKIIEAAQALLWPASATGVTLSSIPDCAQRLVFGKKAESIKPSDNLVQAALAALHKGPLKPRARRCRDQGKDVNRMVYREEGVSDGYLLAVGDTGRLAKVQRVAAGPAASYVVEFYDLGAAHVAGFFRTQPTPDQVFQVSNAAFLGKSLARVSYPGASSAFGSD